MYNRLSQESFHDKRLCVMFQMNFDARFVSKTRTYLHYLPILGIEPKDYD